MSVSVSVKTYCFRVQKCLCFLWTLVCVCKYMCDLSDSGFRGSLLDSRIGTGLLWADTTQRWHTGGYRRGAPRSPHSPPPMRTQWAGSHGHSARPGSRINTHTHTHARTHTHTLHIFIYLPSTTVYNMYTIAIITPTHSTNPPTYDKHTHTCSRSVVHFTVFLMQKGGSDGC